MFSKLLFHKLITMNSGTVFLEYAHAISEEKKIK